MNKFEAPRHGRTEELVDFMLNRVSERLAVRLAVQEKEAFWSNELNEYINFSKQKGPEKRHAENLVTKAASKLLEDPQDINIAEEAWRRIELCRVGDQVSVEQFSKKVNEKMLTIIRKKKESLTPEQFAGLIRIYANKDESQKSTSELAGNLLKNYLTSPKKSRRQRIDAYYNFVSGVLELTKDKKVLDEGVRIAVFSTDILPKDPYLIEQGVLLSMPYGEEEQDFKKIIIGRHIINQISILRSQDFEQYRRENAYFVREDGKAKREWNKKRTRVTKEIGRPEATEFNNIMTDFFRVSQRPLSEAMKQRLKANWPYSVAFDETDLLNQKFERVKAQLASSTQTI